MIPVSNIEVSKSYADELCVVELRQSTELLEHSLRDTRLILSFLRGDAILSRKLATGGLLRKEFNPNEMSQDKIVNLIRPYVLPSRIRDDLYPYQRYGVAWLLRHPRGVLADDMGLGKTYQAISAVRRLFRFGKLNWGLIVVPKPLITNWIEEISKWAPELKMAAVSGSDILKCGGWSKLITSNHLIVTTYDSIRGDTSILLKHPPDLIIADEAHRLRKRESLTFQSFRKLRSNYLWCLTGTPIERAVEDLVVIMSLIKPTQFATNESSLHVSSIKARSRKFILRRKKEEVLSDLPPVIDRVEAIALGKKQRESYDRTARSNSYSNHLAQFNQMRMICDFDEISGESSKIDRIVELLEDIEAAREKVVVFSYTLMPLNIIASRLKAIGLGYELLIGSQDIGKREHVISNFRENPEIVVLLASTKVASEGLTLTEANNVIFVNKWWNPSSNSQARDRVVRIGQKKVVQVISFKAINTLEEGLETILSEKGKTFNDVMSALERDGISTIH